MLQCQHKRSVRDLERSRQQTGQLSQQMDCPSADLSASYLSNLFCPTAWKYSLFKISQVCSPKNHHIIRSFIQSMTLMAVNSFHYSSEHRVIYADMILLHTI